MIYDAIVIGKGPAGISASIYIKRANLNPLVIGKDGGILEKNYKIDNYYGFEKGINGEELILKGIKQAENLGVKIETDEVIDIKFDNNYNVYTRNNEFEAKALIIATGSSRKTSNIKGLKKLEGKGVSYCATCDAFFYRNKEVAVLGSGDYALHEAMELIPIAKKVTILTNGEELVENRSSELNVNEKIIKEVRGENIIESVEFDDKTSLDISGMFIAIGVASSIDLAKKMGAIIEDNKIKVDSQMKTNVPGLFACGDCTGGLLQVCKAAYEGAKAGLSAAQYVRNLK